MIVIVVGLPTTPVVWLLHITVVWTHVVVGRHWTRVGGQGAHIVGSPHVVGRSRHVRPRILPSLIRHRRLTPVLKISVLHIFPPPIKVP